MGADAAQIDFLVDRADLRQVEWSRAGRPEPQPGEIDVKITRFSFTANNVTYAKFGDAIGYWRFFPAPPGRGRIPVWGIGTVERSRSDGIAEGETIYGYLPMSSRVMLRPGPVGPKSFVDVAPHRAELARTYNEYRRLDHDRNYEPEHADAHLVLRPLFSLSFFLAEFLRDEGMFGARRVLVTSASSKTALGLAQRLRTIEGIIVVGLTSPANLAFVRGFGAYHEAIPYDGLDAVAVGEPLVIVDIAGNPALLHELHWRFASAIRHSCLVGATHEAKPDGEPGASLPGPKPAFFFTPDHILARRRSWGEAELARRLAAAWQAFAIEVPRWLTFRHSAGEAAVERVYREVSAGSVPPDRADILAVG